MKQVIAIYARKSVERVDSISIESQIEFCRYEARGAACRIYTDNGYSGKNTQRPAFHEMIADIRSEKIRAVIVYKLDRISRSILDFAEMMELFQEHGVQFISATEKFDTSSPMGRAMLNICIVFAQLERETIQQRVTDAYYSRCKKGLYMGGKVPYGFKLQPTVIDSIHTSMYVPIPEEIAEIRMMYSLYAKPHTTLGDVLQVLLQQPDCGQRSRHWSTKRISELLQNPIYCRADSSIYQFFRSQHANLCSTPEAFNGVNGLYLFKGTSNPDPNRSDLRGRDVVAAPHEGIVDAALWLTCRRKLQQNLRVHAGKARSSWLVGLVRCGNCGHAMSVKKSRRKNGSVSYFCCSLRTASKACTGAGRTVHTAELEATIRSELDRRLASIPITAPEQNHQHNREINAHRIKMEEADALIEELIARIPHANEAVMGHINVKIAALDAQKAELQRKMTKLQEELQHCTLHKLEDCMTVWEQLDFDDKVDVARLLIEQILIFPDHTHIEWKL